MNFGEAALLIAAVLTLLYGALACGILSVALGLCKKSDSRSLFGILSGTLALIIGVSIASRFPWPPSDFERRDAYLSVIVSLLGIIGVIMCARKE